jgi:hypothetical protein
MSLAAQGGGAVDDGYGYAGSDHLTGIRHPSATRLPLHD